jgi:predicted transcriptional regulator of viral defense system
MVLLETIGIVQAMARSYKEALDRLYRVAESQQGYFTAKQAKRCGFAGSAQHYHVQVGNWVREHRGVYRLARFPQSDDSHLVLWSLWSRDRQDKPQAVYSCQTALAIHDLSDLMPSKLHMTVPRRFRRNSEIPPVLVLHSADLADADIDSRAGFRVTRPLRTIIDLMRAGDVAHDVLAQAFREALSRGMVARAQTGALPSDGQERLWPDQLLREVA